MANYGIFKLNGDPVAVDFDTLDAARDAMSADAEKYAGCYADEAYTCAECGRVLPEDICAFYGGRAYCADCFDDLFETCADCGEPVPVGYAVEVHRGRGVVYLCDDCARRYTEECSDCGERYDRDAMTYTRDGWMCEDCASAYYYCGECGDYVSADDWDDDAEMCTACAESAGSPLVKSYHTLPANFHFIGKTKTGGHFHIGIEKEIDRDRPNAAEERACVDDIVKIAGDAVYFNRDGSLDYGFEIITLPHTPAEFFKIDWRGILAACERHGYKSHDGGNCGLHMHFSREFFGKTKDAQERAIAKLIRFYDVFYADVQAVARRDDYHARKWAAPYETRTRADAEEYAKGEKYAGRYHAVNNTNRETVEVRIMRGTLNYDTFAACIDFLLATARRARRIKWRDVENAGEWLRNLKPATREYIKARGAFAGVM